jgi:hypothetical protein
MTTKCKQSKKQFRKNRKSRKHGGHRPGTQENIHNCKTYWHSPFNSGKCTSTSSTSYVERIDYPGFQRKMNGEVPRYFRTKEIATDY